MKTVIGLIAAIVIAAASLTLAVLSLTGQLDHALGYVPAGPVCSQYRAVSAHVHDYTCEAGASLVVSGDVGPNNPTLLVDVASLSATGKVKLSGGPMSTVSSVSRGGELYAAVPDNMRNATITIQPLATMKVEVYTNVATRN